MPSSAKSVSIEAVQLDLGATEQKYKKEISQLQKATRAANYITAAQLYLVDNTLLEAPLKNEHIKERLLGHWGTFVCDQQEYGLD